MATFRWLCDPQLQAQFLLREAPQWERHVVYWERVLTDSTQRAYAILSAGIHVGNCGVKHLTATGEGELWIYIGDRQRRSKGLGAAAFAELLRRTADELALRRVYVHVRDDDPRLQRFYRRFGFQDAPVLSREWLARGVAVRCLARYLQP